MPLSSTVISLVTVSVNDLSVIFYPTLKILSKTCCIFQVVAYWR